jgi:SNF2 family DNA or RNA helicase
MISSGPSRSFTQDSVESWFWKLSDYNWENQFCQKSLLEGRNFYREGKISSLDISPEQIILIRKINREESYSVMEWKGEKLEFRTSLEDENLGMAIAVAGLYELEELIAEIHEDNPMIGGLSNVQVKKEIEDDLQGNLPIKKFDDKSSNQQIQQETHSLQIELSISGKRGLVAAPKWKDNHGNCIPVYGHKRNTGKLLADGSKLIKFARESVETGFIFDKEKGVFTLNDWEQVGEFATFRIRDWEEAFKLKYIGEASLIKKGNNEVRWEVEAHSKNEGTMQLQDNFQVGNKKLNSQLSWKMSKLGKGTMFFQGHGLIKLNREQIEDFEWWKKNKGENDQENWPRYMLFSLFARKYLRTRPDGELAKWEAAIRGAKHTKLNSKFSFLRSYQKKGVSRLRWLNDLGCHGLLADEMGLGKTVQSLALLRSSKKLALPDLVVCPASVVPVWIQEVATHFPGISVEVLKQDNNFTRNSKSCLWIASYTQIRRHRTLLEKKTFRYAILDEAQMIKNPKAKVTQACLAINAKFRLALSGTPIENSAIDLWTIFRFLMPGLLGSRKELENELQKDAQKTFALIKRQIAPFIIRRMKQDVAKELPPKIQTEVPCILNQEQKKAYKLLVEQGILECGENLDKAVRNSPTHLFSLLTRLRQTCCDLRLLPNHKQITENGAKATLLIQKLNDLSMNGSKAIVFSQFTSFLSILEKIIKTDIPDLQVVKLTGATRDRTKPVKTFQETEKPAVILASLKAAGLGVTLTAADYVFLMDPWWNPAVEEQAVDRAHRIGRSKPLFIYRFIAQGTIEERVRELQKEKKETFSQIVGDLERPNRLLNHFSSLDELIKLRET